MKFGLKQIGVALLFVMGVADASAGPSGNRWDVREWTQAFQLQRAAVDRGEQRNDSRGAAPNERRRGGDVNRPDSSGFGNLGDNPSGNANDNSRKQGRMSPEERRALRRQIDEAGHDIYRPKR